jgi:hypothetical protein
MAVNGLTEETVLAAILSSPEYFNRAAALLGQTPSDPAFLTRLYQQILGRTPAQAEIDFWVGILGQVTRFPVAYAFLNSPEFRTNTVTSFYTDLLRRTAPPSAQEVAGWVNSSADLALIRIAFESSVEYYFRATGFFP